MDFNVKALVRDFKRLTGFEGRGATSRLALQCKILPATLYNLEATGKDFTVTTLIRLARGTGLDWSKIGALLERHYKD